ncbi:MULTISPECIES: D-amino-acid transaminase [Ensifer]|jgi:D-alanine transaminase|uniref:Probable branched-chain-amino-acid aminotransferase n=1 Tax=Ensifer canadensis TaxID=555315 RepID=A0AAW4FE65_9HYPH|nr:MULTISPECIES: D-amino-acid transaminase [Ensifer]AHK44204.1 D-alanine aminotransferase protein [Ensifer adhaerens OV14]KQU96933.1 D-amino acid aminotransferase [Ensifer sp. Root31]KQW75463.1 D-amino acid aminotransferase [Ensifer sp. Root127]KQY67018.1 D-amino acid aminotransferase [Ensifer sp. Root142]MBD9490569.1 D-amino-acid transaminase [Ensifer sp. ENS11]
MPRIAYVNGAYVPHADAAIHIEDRGYQFADGVYEVCEIRHGFIVDLTRHLDRLSRSLSELRIDWPMSRAALIHVIREVLRRNRVRNGLFYMQVTRGTARRDHVFPAKGTVPTIVVTAKRTDAAVIARKNAEGISAITVPENRWDRVDIKSVGLLPNVLARQRAKEEGAHEAIFVDPDGTVKEGAATNVWIVDRDGVLRTRPADHGILRGITRTTLMDVAAPLGIRIEERAFTVDDMLAAREVFITAATSICFPVVSIDGKPIGNGHPGSIAQNIREAFFGVAEKTLI